MIVTFKLEKGIYYVDDEEYCEEIEKYNWEVPEDILKRAIISYYAEQYNFDKDFYKFKKFVEDNDLYDILEEKNEEDLKEFIKDRFENQAMQDYYEECE